MQIFQSDNLCHLLSINFAGNTYASEMGMDEPDLTHIPEQLDITGKPFVDFDLEATGFGNLYIIFYSIIMHYIGAFLYLV